MFMGRMKRFYLGNITFARIFCGTDRERPFNKKMPRCGQKAFVSGIINNMNEIHGNTAGLRSRTVEELKGLYEFKLSHRNLPRRICFEMARLTEVTGKEISVFLSRAARVLDASVGTDKSVKLPYMRVRRGIGGRIRHPCDTRTRAEARCCRMWISVR